MGMEPLKFPPGLYRAGTAYQSKGRYYDCNLVRFYQDTIQPVGGWQPKSDIAATGKGRAIISWHDNSALTWSAIGTDSNLYALSRSGTLSDITPSGFTPGLPDAISEGGYGSGTYGSGLYGTPRIDATAVQDAAMWSLDTWGEDLVGAMADDGKIYEWALDVGTSAAEVANAPTAAAILVTQERILMALAAENNPRRVKWSDAEDNTVWTASATNQAGDFDLQTNGRILQGLRVKGANLILTDIDAWTVTYTADEFVYKPNKAGEGCGAISRGAGINLDAQAVWMGRSGFWLFNGYVTSLPCDVWDDVFGDLNDLQISKITCEMNSDFGEVTWHYPSASSVEINRSVTWNFRENHWRLGYVVRLCGIDRGVTAYPLMVGNDGYVYEHETGFAYGGVAPYLESGPLELGMGDQVQYASLLMPDDKTVGDVTATFFVKFEPDGEEFAFGPYTLTKRTDLRFCGRSIRVRYDGVAMSSWRIGVPRLDVSAGGGR